MENSGKKDELVEIHMYFGGKFRSHPTTAYVGDYKIGIWKDRDPKQMSIIRLCRMFKQVEPDATKVTFWWCVPDLDMESGLLPIAGNDDIKIMNSAHVYLPIRVIYSVSGEQAFEEPSTHVGGGDSSNEKEGAHADQIDEANGEGEQHAAHDTVGADVDISKKNDEPDWLEEGLETIDDEDIFVGTAKTADKSQNLKTSKLHVFSIKGDRKSPNKRLEQPIIQTKETTAEFHSACSHLNSEDIVGASSQPVKEKGKGEDKGKKDKGKGAHKGKRIEPDVAEQILVNGEEHAGQEFEDINSKSGEEADWNEEVIPDHQLLDSIGSDGEEQREYLDFDVEVEFKKTKFELKVGHRFTDFQVFRMVLNEWNIREGYEVSWIRNDSYRITAKCARGCTWRIHASPVQKTQTFQIKTMKGEHVCGREYTNKHVTATYLSRTYQFKVRDDPKCNLVGFQKDIRREMMVDVTASKVYRAKRKAKAEIQGCDMEQYHNLWHYAATVRKYNPGSTVKIQIDRPSPDEFGTFERMYYCLHACKQGFLDGCRPIIGLDGCFLKSCFGGQLLAAMGRDANDNMFPIAMAVVEVERYDSWKWFLQQLMDDLGMGMDSIPWTFISDRQKGLVHAVKELFPDSEHRFCLRHMYQNFSQKFKGKHFKDLFWACASTGNEYDWRAAMQALEKADKDAAAWLAKFPPSLWSRSHFGASSKCDILVNNLNESFNNYILDARELPVVGMFELIRRKLMQRIQVKRTGMEKYEGNICPNIKEKIDKNILHSRLCVGVWAGDLQYEIDAGINTKVVVNLEDWTCTCGLFQLNGYPCVHGCAAIQARRGSVLEYVHSCFSRETYLRTYAHMIKPVPSARYWVRASEDPINPPAVRKMPGRPKKLRKRSADEPKKGQVSTRKGLTVHCKRCLQPNHNSRTCKNAVHPQSKFYKVPEQQTSAAHEQQTSAAHEQQTSAATVRKRKAYTQPTVSSVNKAVSKNPIVSQPTSMLGNDGKGTPTNAEQLGRRYRPPTVAAVLESIRAKRCKRNPTA